MKLIFHYPPLLVLLAFVSPTAYAATAIPFTVNMSEPVNVTGCPGNCPRIVLDVGGTGTPKYANYTSGSGTAALTFTYTAQEGDLDLDGITISSNSIDLNTSGTIKDLSGNNLSPATFTLPNTTGIKVDYPSLAMDFINNDYLLSGTHYASLPTFLSNAGGTFTRASTATYFDAAGTMQTAASGVPRFDYDPITHVAKGLLIEESKTNVLTNSSQLDQSGWNTRAGSTTVAAAVTSPNGAATSYLETKSSSDGYVWQFFNPTASTTYTYSIFVKGGASASTITLHSWDGVVSANSSAIAIPAGQSWTRVSLTFTTSASVGGGDFGFYTGANPFYAWGAQLEAGNFPTSYIPTAAAAVTRQADDFRIPTGPWHNAATSTLVGNGASNGVSTGSASTLADIDNNTWSQRFQIRLAGVPPTSYGGIITDTAVQASLGGAGYTSGNYAKVGMAATLNNSSLYGDGTLVGTDASLTMPLSVTQMRVGSVAGGAEFMNGWIKSIKYYPARVSDAQLQLLTQ